MFSAYTPTKPSEKKKILMGMANMLAGQLPIDQHENIVTKLLCPGSCFGQANVTTKTVDLPKSTIFAFLMSHVLAHNPLLTTTQVLDLIPQKAWTTYNTVFKTATQTDAIKFYELINSKYCNKAIYRPFVQELATRLGTQADILYAEKVYKVDVDTTLNPTTSEIIQTVKKTHQSGYLKYSDLNNFLNDRKSLYQCGMLDVESIKYHLNKAYPLPNTTYESKTCQCKASDLKNIIIGCHQVCKQCGMVVGEVMEHEPIFENGEIVQHTTTEPALVPQHKRYMNKDTTRNNQKALLKNRVDFHVKVESFFETFYLERNEPLKVYFKAIWDMLVEMGYSPSGTNSRKSGCFSIKVMVVAYMVWRLVQPRHEHVFDFDYETKNVKYLMLDMDKSITKPWYIPSKKETSITYSYGVNQYYSHGIVKDISNRADSPENVPFKQDPPSCEPVINELKKWESNQVSSSTSHSKIIQNQLKWMIQKSKRFMELVPDSTNAFNYSLCVNGHDVTYRMENNIQNKENLCMVPISENTKDIGLDYGLFVKPCVWRATLQQITCKSIEFIYNEMPCRILKKTKSGVIFGLMNYKLGTTLKGIITLGQRNSKEIRHFPFTTTLENIHVPRVAVFSPTTLVNKGLSALTGMIIMKLQGLPVKLVNIEQQLNKYVTPQFSPIMAKLHKRQSTKPEKVKPKRTIVIKKKKTRKRRKLILKKQK